MTPFRHGLRTGLIALGAFGLLAAAACGDDTETKDGGSGGGGTTTTSSTAQTGTTTSTGTVTTSTGAGDGGGGGDAGSGGGTSSGGDGGSGGSGGAGGDGTGGSGGDEPAWAAPKCDDVAGTASLTFSRDEGDTLAPRGSSLSGVSYAAGVAALDIPDVLLVAANGVLLRSDDAGCTFTELGAISSGYTRITAAPGGRAYVWQEGYTDLFLVEGDAITPLRAPGQPGVDGIVGVGVDPLDGTHVRVGLYDGTIWDSTDAGEVFDPIGTVPEDQCFYQVVFDPQDIDHVVCGTLTTGTWVTLDGGETWDRSRLDVQYANAFRVAISPIDSSVVWIEGLENDLFEGEVVGTLIRHVWYSTDGGVSFTTVIDEDSEIGGDGGLAELFNGNFLAPHPTDPDVLYFTYGIQPMFGEPNKAELYRLDVGDDAHTLERQTGGDIDDYTAIAFNPGDPGIVYFALSSERTGG